jgi:formate-dependent nitrite reductase membrane component NrfD
LIAGAFAVLSATYTAFLFAQAKGRDYWQNPLLAVTMLADAFVAGIAVAVLIGQTDWTGGVVDLQAKMWMALGILALAGLTLVEFFTRHATANAARTANLILHGRYRVPFWGGVIGVGLIAPAILIFVQNDAGNVAAALLLLLGIAIKNHILVQAPQRVPLS